MPPANTAPDISLDQTHHYPPELIRLLSYRSALLRSTPPVQNAHKRANLIDFVGERRHWGLGGGAEWIRTIGAGF